MNIIIPESRYRERPFLKLIILFMKIKSTKAMQHMKFQTHNLQTWLENVRFQ